jgi:hypothetical protein
MKNAFKHFLLYNALFFLLQIFFITQQSHSFVSTLSLPKYIYWEIGYTLYIQFFGYIIISILQSCCDQSLKNHWFSGSQHKRQWFLLIHTWITIISLNAYYFPLSQYSRLMLSIFPRTGILCCGFISVSIITYALIYSFIQWCQNYPLPIITLGLCLISTAPPIIYQEKTNQPNVFIIGVDSLSPSSIDATRTPTLWHFVHENVWFQEAISPLARTYPAWSTILSGLHPAHHQVRYNLIRTRLAAEKSIAWEMKQKHYTTLFATDDRRFNLLDESFGFQHIIGPREGVNDMLLGTFNDFLLGNLFINSQIGKWFFPYNYMNRASYFSYYPQTFNQALKQAIETRESGKPIFMAVHFTLPHWPYAYASSSDPSAYQEYNIADRIPLYQQALRAADQQVYTFLQTLKNNHLLHHALVIVLSDHGETLYTPLSRPLSRETYQATEKSVFETYLEKHTSTVLDRSAGHGSDVLSPEQFHCVVAMQYYHQGQPQYSARRIKERIGLQDVAPTLLDYTHQATASLDGISLRPYVEQKKRIPQRTFILESGMLPNQFLSREQARLAGKTFFEVDPITTLLHIRQDKLDELDKQKLYAVLKNHWILALYPTKKKYIPVLQETNTKAWTDDLNSAFAQHSPAKSLLKALKSFYKTNDFKI